MNQFVVWASGGKVTLYAALTFAYSMTRIMISVLAVGVNNATME